MAGFFYVVFSLIKLAIPYFGTNTTLSAIHAHGMMQHVYYCWCGIFSPSERI
ncbi:hypothetical protein HMPREF1565_3800 [Providencia alcalifaciens RIMD 1656011]|uniref:Uncharacterized protein n=2 Tax=Providencia alcalifaciens TaxID=126385 RepID=B6XA04_9GAMM|nr:hypothetical protein PROVALCAL_00150 [Providencia alcalifaciens DSM 30120]ETT04494.1 hypothetical protein HMPREF1562_3991 [Providencia alcalifaciens F90-2004]EUC96833.1 hypothetical protein HMPREF1567_0338 [Providencia alcalifaciens PAL-2]EUD03454.1 hypothetical protein HMPREF1565_3800 [Providencia alcalifaciens RIMD 1656011]EUD10137.1 hypothetical protein HMPREF1563_3129 [Providencia alcalifaciens 205/92]